MSQLYPTTTITVDTNLNPAYLVYLIDPTAGNITVTLPPLTNDGLTFVLKRIVANNNTVTVATPDAKPIDGSSTLTILNGTGVTLTSKGNDWYSVSSVQPYVPFEGFSAYNYASGGVIIATQAVADNIITNWVDSPIPFLGGTFNTASGVYTVPSDGVYDLRATVPIQWVYPGSSITNANSLSADCNPYLHLYSSATATSLCMANLGVNAVVSGAESVRYPVHRQTVSLSTICYLTTSDTITLRCNVNSGPGGMGSFVIYIAGGGSTGLGFPLPSNPPFNTVSPGATFSIRRVV